MYVYIYGWGRQSGLGQHIVLNIYETKAHKHEKSLYLSDESIVRINVLYYMWVYASICQYTYKCA